MKHNVPLGKVLIALHVASGTTDGGIVLPENAKEKPTSGSIIGIGLGRTAQEQKYMESLHIGDHAWFNKHAGTEIKAEGVEVLSLQINDLLLVSCGHQEGKESSSSAAASDGRRKGALKYSSGKKSKK